LDGRRVEVKDWISFWSTYRKTTGELTWRVATPEDLPRILKLRKIMDRFLGQKQDDPLLFSRPVLLCLVAENRDGLVVDGLYVEAKVEILKLNCTERGFRETAALVDDLYPWLKALGFRFANVVVTNRLADRMGATLKACGFSKVRDVFTYWVQRL
jgi:hypothetical protein